MRYPLASLLALGLLVGCASDESAVDVPDGSAAEQPAAEQPAVDETAIEDASPKPVPHDLGPHAVRHPDDPSEPRLRNVRQLTFGGENAEAYWSWDQQRIIFQMRGRRGVVADQMFIMGLDASGEHMVSTGGGRTTCGYFLKGDTGIVYASTRHNGIEPPKPPPKVKGGGYTWALYDYDVYTADLDGSNERRITHSPVYDAEPTVGPDGRIVFTSARDGDLEIYTMNPDGSDVKRLTHEPGYDGGPFFSHDGKLIVYRAHHPDEPEAQREFKELLDAGWVKPTRMNVWIMNSDGTNKRQVTTMSGANWAPSFHPDGKRIIFASNHADPRGRNFDLYIVNIDGTGLEQVTSSPEFDAFPIFSWDGKHILWSSNRHAKNPRHTNVFLADWVE